MTDPAITIGGELHIAGLASIDVGEFKPKPTALTAGLVEASRVLWKSPDGSVSIGGSARPAPSPRHEAATPRWLTSSAAAAH